MKTASRLLLIGMFFLTTCSSAGESTFPLITSTVTISLQPVATTTPVPTPSSPGDTVVWEDLQVTMDQLEVTQDYVTEYGSSRVPPAGAKFLWVHLRLKNVGQTQLDVPVAEHFSVLYAAMELKPTYGHRKDYTEYTALRPVIFPAQELNAWLRFDVPTTAELSDLRFVFLPESAEVGTSFNSPNYPYAKDKPTYVWKCEP